MSTSTPIRAPKGTVATGPKKSRGRRAIALVTPYRILCSVGLAVAAGLLLVGFWSSKDGQPIDRSRPSEVLRVFPGENDKLRLRQEPVGFQLAEGFTGELIIDSRQIPLDELQRPEGSVNGVQTGLTGLNQFSFTPGEGTVIPRLEPGSHTATATYYRRGTETLDQGKSYTWTFNVG